MAKRKLDLNSKVKSVNLSGQMSSFEKAVLEEKAKSVQSIPLSLIVPNEKNYYSIEDIEGLAFLIEQSGQLQPALVVPQDGKYRLIAGERRYRAIKSLKWNTIEAIVLDDLSEVDEEILLISANAYRTKTEAEKAREIATLTELFEKKNVQLPDYLKGKNPKQAVAEYLDVSQAQVFRANRFVKLIPSLQQLADDKKIGVSTAQIFADLPEESQTEIVSLIDSSLRETGKFNREDGENLKKYYTDLLNAKTADLELSQTALEQLKKELEEKDAQLAQLRENPVAQPGEGEKTAFENRLKLTLSISALRSHADKIGELLTEIRQFQIAYGLAIDGEQKILYDDTISLLASLLSQSR